MERLNRPIIMTAQMGKAEFAWADSLRRRYFPPEREHHRWPYHPVFTILAGTGLWN